MITTKAVTEVKKMEFKDMQEFALYLMTGVDYKGEPVVRIGDQVYSVLKGLTRGASWPATTELNVTPAPKNYEITLVLDYSVEA